MNINFYNITKRLNSTMAAPAPAAVLDCYLKNDCSFLNPYLRVNSSTKPSYNYFKLEDRYYWITEVTSIANELWELRGSVDPLTTFRGHIFNTSAFVLYDSTPNTQLPDSRLGIESDCETHTSTASMPWYYTTGTSGTYFIATVGETDSCNIETDISNPTIIPVVVDTDRRNGTGVYAIPEAEIRKIGFDIADFFISLGSIIGEAKTKIEAIRTEISQISPVDVVGALKDLIKIYAEVQTDVLIDYPTRLLIAIAQNLIGGGNALQNVKASYWLPFTVPAEALNGQLGTHPTELALGTYTDIISGLKRVSEPIITAVNINVAIPWQFNDWRDVACTEIMLYIPLIGCIAIPPEVVKGNDTIDLKFALNLYSGELAVEISCNGGQIGTYGCNCAMNILIGDSNINMGGAVNTVIAGITKNFAGIATSAIDTFSGMNTSVGGIGGGAGTGLTNQIVCVVRTHNTSQNPSVLLPVIGTPTRQLKTLSQGLGYCQTLNAQVNCAAITGEPYPTQTEIDMINSYLNAGVYLE